MNKKGSATIEACFGILLVLVVLLAVLNFISISYEKNFVSQQVEILAVQTSINGGLIYKDFESFVAALSNKGYDVTKMIITANRVVDGVSVGSNILLMDEFSSGFVSMIDGNNQIQLSITVPYKDETIFYSLFNDLYTMQFERRVMSRRK